MPKEIFFQCSLPRTGSTLFQNLIAQDERIYASGNSGLLNLVNAAKSNYINGLEFKAQDANMMKRAFGGFCKSAMHGYYDAITDRPYVLDKSRGNFANYNYIHEFYPYPKIICFVRDMSDIFASTEILYRNNQYKESILDKMQGTTTFKRVNIWHQSNQNLINTFYENAANGLNAKMLFIKYESFCTDPQKEVNKFYDFIGLTRMKLDLCNIEQTIKENEKVYEENYPGLLKIRPMVSYNESKAKQILGVDIYTWICNTYRKYNDIFHY